MINYDDYLESIGVLDECDFSRMLDKLPQMKYISEDSELMPGMEDYEVAIALLENYIIDEFNIDVDEIDVDSKTLFCSSPMDFSELEDLKDWLSKYDWTILNYKELTTCKEGSKKEILLYKLSKAPIEQLEEFVKQLN